MKKIFAVVFLILMTVSVFASDPIIKDVEPSLLDYIV